jgi:phytoene dehydrogenase-like protein
MHYDVAIIGAGMSGLAAGVRLAHFGRRVCILEKHYLWGGLNSFYKKDGHHFDTGLHAVTNWVAPGYKGPRPPMSRVLRQLRIRHEELELDPQTFSEIVFGDVRLRFENGLDVLTEEIAKNFPDQIDGFRRLCAQTVEYPDPTIDTPAISARRMLSEYLSDPMLTDMLLCPLLWYGSAQQEDLDFNQFIALFNSVFREGFCRPRRGIRAILDTLVKKFEAEGGEMRRRCAVERLVIENGRCTAIELEKGEPITADVVLSSAGLIETGRLRTDGVKAPEHSAGELGFTESVWIVSKDPKELGVEACVTFFNLGDRFRWRRPDVPVDLGSGIITIPSNYAHADPLDKIMIRGTHLADHRAWFGWDEETYQREKAQWVARSRELIAKYFRTDFGPHVEYTDAFTPRTVTQYTSKVNGAIYGSPNKTKTGATDLSNVFLIGTDQGMVGIVGAMISGVAMANRWVLHAEAV